MDNKIINSLGKIPALTESVEKLIKMTSEILQRGVKARMTEEDTQKLVGTMKTTIRETPCATPDASRSSQLIADGVLRELKGTIQESVREAVMQTRVKVENQHVHTTAWGAREIIEKKLRNRLLVYFSLIVILVLAIGINSFVYYSSEDYLGKEYVNVCFSKYTTENERNLLWNDLYSTGALPQDFQKSRDHYIQSLKRNKAILKDRERQARANKGKYSTKIPLER